MSHPFDDIVEHYDDDHFHVKVAQRMIDGLPSGFTALSVLDIGTGTGHAALLAARALRPGSVVAVDLSAAMIAAARRKADAETSSTGGWATRCQHRSTTVRWTWSSVPLPEFAPLFTSDIELPTAAHAAGYASRAGFTDPVVSEVKVVARRP